MALSPLLSIVIPTKNRQKQCVESVRSVIAFEEPFELIVFDSSDDGEILSRDLAAMNDNRIRHIHVPLLANMTECFEAAIAPASGTFVCLIGDDDGVTPSLFDWARRAAEEGLTSVTTAPAVYATYNWPGIRSKYFGDAVSGKLFMRLDQNITHRIVDARTQIDGFLKAAGQGCGSMPRIYHGIVARSALIEIAAKVGRCFDGVSPDVSFSFFAAHFSPRHAIVNLPLTITGASVESNAGRSAMRQHKGDLWSDPHMRHYIDEPWPAQVPEFFSVETVWGQATLAALSRVREDERNGFNFARFYSLLLVRHPDRWREIIAVLRKRDLKTRLGTVCQLGPVLIEHGLYAARKILQQVWSDRKVHVTKADSLGVASMLVANSLKTRERASQ